MGKTLVAYFSASGSTAHVAREIAEALAADLYEIAPAERYTAADLDWTDKRSRSSQEMADDTCRPALAGELPGMEAFDTVFLGFPIWWYVEPRAVDTFVEGADLADKTVIPFATSGGSGIARAERRLASLVPDATWMPGRLLNGSGTAAWAREARA